MSNSSELQTKWINKLQISYVDTSDNGGRITIEWDDADPDLALWNSWDEECQKQFILDALNLAITSVLSTDET